MARDRAPPPKPHSLPLKLTLAESVKKERENALKESIKKTGNQSYETDAGEVVEVLNCLDHPIYVRDAREKKGEGPIQRLNPSVYDCPIRLRTRKSADKAISINLNGSGFAMPVVESYVAIDANERMTRNLPRVDGRRYIVSRITLELSDRDDFVAPDTDDDAEGTGWEYGCYEEPCKYKEDFVKVSRRWLKNPPGKILRCKYEESHMNRQR